MSDNKIIFMDIDGTLTDYASKTPKSAVTAIRQAMDHGHQVYLCTGCSLAEIRQRHLIETTGILGGNGAFITIGDRIIMHKCLSKEQVKHIVDWCSNRNLGFYLETNSGMYCNNGMLQQGVETMTRYAMGKGRLDSEAEAFGRQFLTQMTCLQNEDLYREDVNKVSFVLSTYQDHLDSINEFPDMEAHTWGGKGEEALFGDLGPRGITKKSAVDFLLQYLHAARSDTIAFGDAKIDIPMFEACGYSVAMGNGGL